MDIRRTRAGAAPLWALVGLVAFSACQDGGDPSAPTLDDPTLAEAALDAAAVEADVQQQTLFAEAERTRQRDRDRSGDRPAVDRARLAVDVAGTAVGLAGDILAREGADERQRALLARAREHYRAAVAALGEGDPGLAVREAEAACWTALKAWVLPGGVTRDEAAAVEALATDLLTDAVRAVGDDDGVRGLVLSWAVRFHAHGTAQLEAGQTRGVAALWKAAVFSAWLIG